MDDKQITKLIFYAVTAIATFYILEALVPFLIWGIVGLIAWRVYQEYQKSNK